MCGDSEDLVYQCPLCGRVESEICIESARYDYRCLGRGSILNCGRSLSDYTLIKGSDAVNLPGTGKSKLENLQ